MKDEAKKGNQKAFDLEERTVGFGRDIIRFCRKVPLNAITIPIVTQLIKAGTSVGANYHEADCAETRKDFEHKIGICKKEAKETKYWLQMIIVAQPNLIEEAKPIQQESIELALIFIAIVKKSRQNSGVGIRH